MDTESPRKLKKKKKTPKTKKQKKLTKTNKQIWQSPKTQGEYLKIHLILYATHKHGETKFKASKHIN